MNRLFILSALLLGVFALPALHAQDPLDDDSARERHDAAAEKIREQYANKRLLKMKLEHIARMEAYSIANFSVTDQPIGEALKMLRDQVRQQDADGVGFNLAFQCDRERLTRPVTLSMRDVPLPDLLRYLGMQAQLGFEYEKHAIVVKNLEDAEVIDLNKIRHELAQ